jgi:hypothetical protein
MSHRVRSHATKLPVNVVSPLEVKRLTQHLLDLIPKNLRHVAFVIGGNTAEVIVSIDILPKSHGLSADMWNILQRILNELEQSLKLLLKLVIKEVGSGSMSYDLLSLRQGDNIQPHVEVPGEELLECLVTSLLQVLKYPLFVNEGGGTLTSELVIIFVQKKLLELS